ncbi:nucleotidyltransferase family protein [Pseudomonadota bacterium]
MTRLLECEANLARFDSFLQDNKLYGFVFSKCSAANLLDCLPKEFRRNMQEQYARQTKRNLRLLSETSVLGELYEQREIDAIFIKGPVSVVEYYEHLGERLVWDIDVLLRSKVDLDPACGLLESEGYELQSKPFFGKTLSIMFTHHYEYRKVGVKLDLHWVLQSHFSYRLDNDRVWATRKSYDIDGTSVNGLSYEYEILLRTISIFTDLQRGANCYRAFIDMYLLLEKLYEKINWDDYFQERARERLLTISVNVLDLFMEIFGVAGRYPELENHIALRASSIVLKDSAQKRSLLISTPLSMRNKVWGLRAYETNLVLAVLWWIVSIPVKMTIYRSVLMKPLQQLVKKTTV